MFQSYEYQKYLGYDAATKEHKWQYKIIDSDFEDVGVGVGVGVEVGVRVVRVGVGIAVIEVYEKRNLNVAANLLKVILYLHKLDPDISIQEIIEDNRKYNPKFAQYEEDLNKYLCLL